MYRHRQDALQDGESRNKRRKYEEMERKYEEGWCCFDDEKRQLVAAHDDYRRG
jgi:hypothetical protein